MEPDRTPQAGMSTLLTVNGMEESTQNPSSISSPARISRSPSTSITVINGNLVPVVPPKRHIAKDKRAIRTEIHALETEAEALRAEKRADREMHSSDPICREGRFEEPGFDSKTSTVYSQQARHPTDYMMPAPGMEGHNFPPRNPADYNPPCNTLYVGNLPIDTSEDELKSLFSKQRGYKRLCFRTKQNGPMCFVEFEDVSFATKALCLRIKTKLNSIYLTYNYSY